MFPCCWSNAIQAIYARWEGIYLAGTEGSQFCLVPLRFCIVHKRDHLLDYNGFGQVQLEAPAR
jgi:hypothetical protein